MRYGAQVGGHIFSNQLSIEIRILDFNDVNLDLFSIGKVADFLGQIFNFLTSATNHNARTCCVDRDADAIPCTLDNNSCDCSLFEFLLERCADFLVEVNELYRENPE